MTKKPVNTDREILSHYEKIGELLAEMFEPHLEVAVHDLRYPEHSIIAIFNGHITGRNIGEGTSDLGYEKVSGKVPDKVVNYKNESPDGKPLKSSSLTIRNNKGDIIGSLGLNYDISVFDQFSNVLSIFTNTEENTIIHGKEAFFYGNTKEDIHIAINHYKISNGLTNKVLSRKDKGIRCTSANSLTTCSAACAITLAPFSAEAAAAFPQAPAGFISCACQPIFPAIDNPRWVFSLEISAMVG